jgi:hypothetical protein
MIAGGPEATYGSGPAAGQPFRLTVATHVLLIYWRHMRPTMFAITHAPLHFAIATRPARTH